MFKKVSETRPLYEHFSQEEGWGGGIIARSIANPNPRGGETIPVLSQANIHVCVHVHNQIHVLTHVHACTMQRSDHGSP